MKKLVYILLFGSLTGMVLKAPIKTNQPIAPYLNGVFPASTPGQVWELADPLPDMTFRGPLRMLPFPGSEDLMILLKVGEIRRISLESQTQAVLLDIKDQVFDKGEGGSVGMVLHPEFGNPAQPDKQWVFVFYRTKPNPDQWDERGFNRLSKFSWDEQKQAFDPESEEILIQHYDRMTWHNGGAMFFGEDGFLYLSLGDEGGASHQKASTQKIDKGLFSGLIRIDVDNDPTRSHPIRRQPIPTATAPTGWGETFTQGYSIPNDNPWVNPDGSVLEEFYAIGIRSPYSTHLDTATGQIWLADVGAGKQEEISLIEKGDNLQWPYLEGTFQSEDHEKPANLIGNEKPVYYKYGRDIGSCIIGGGVYRGDRFPSLKGKYIFGDYTSGRIMALTNTGPQSAPEVENLLNIFAGQPVDLPNKPAISGFYFMTDGRILITVLSENAVGPGKVYSLETKSGVPDPPQKLSELNVFTDLETLTPRPGIIPYAVNAPLWSDRAVKRRWMAIPNDGVHDSRAEQIEFDGIGEWTFPGGTVFIKHFDLPVTDEVNGPLRKLETRFFILNEAGMGYGLTYKWNDAGTDAFLLTEKATKDFDIYDNGQWDFTQTWTYPSRTQCMSCHNANAKFVLGVKTHQLNGDYFYPDLGQTMNQLTYLNEQQIFTHDIGNPGRYSQAREIGDETADLELRIRSYLDANCASCHRQGGPSEANLDLRFSLPLTHTEIINAPVRSQASDPDRFLIVPGNHRASELWVRDSSLSENRMPPLGRSVVDQTYVDALATWINQLTDEASTIAQTLVYPNPTDGLVNIRMADDWPDTFRIRIRAISGGVISDAVVTQKTIRLDLGDLKQGIYIIELRGDNKREAYKIVLNN
jgi:uncharacterized repeat protein (TIGR03806 family)